MQVTRSAHHSPEATAAPRPGIGAPYLVVAFIFLAHTLVSLLGLTKGLPPFGVALLLVSNLAIFVLAYRRLDSFRAWLDGLSTENLVLLHAVRAPIGAAFLVFAAIGLLPELLAIRAGWGDILAGALGVGVVCVLAFGVSAKLRWFLLLAWSVIGIFDLFLAVGTGIFLAITQEGSMDWITLLPLFLVPGFLVPWLLALHGVVLSRLFRSERMG